MPQHPFPLGKLRHFCLAIIQISCLEIVILAIYYDIPG